MSSTRVEWSPERTQGRQADGSILISGTITRKYYAFAGQTVAMVECGPQGCGAGLRYFLADTLGSVVAVANVSGGLLRRQAYYPYGGIRTDIGTVTQTDFGYTDQRNLDAQGNSYWLGLMDYLSPMAYLLAGNMPHEFRHSPFPRIYSHPTRKSRGLIR